MKVIVLPSIVNFLKERNWNEPFYSLINKTIDVEETIDVPNSTPIDGLLFLKYYVFKLYDCKYIVPIEHCRNYKEAVIERILS
jgi:hypothetical protein